MEAALLVTGAGAIAIFAHGLGTAIAGFVLVRPIITRMTTRTIGLECRVLPGDSLGV